MGFLAVIYVRLEVNKRGCLQVGPFKIGQSRLHGNSPGGHFILCGCNRRPYRDELLIDRSLENTHGNSLRHVLWTGLGGRGVSSFGDSHIILLMYSCVVAAMGAW